MNRTRLMFKTLGLSCGLMIFAAPTLSHHSFAMFDFDKIVTLEGTIELFQWTNPHVVIWIKADAENGDEPQIWGIELTSPGNLTRAGWTKRSLNPGDRVSIAMSPLRSGNAGGGFRQATLLDSGEDLTYDWARLAQVQGRSE